METILFAPHPPPETVSVPPAVTVLDETVNVPVFGGYERGFWTVIAASSVRVL
jgi:hypothetical protein